MKYLKTNFFIYTVIFFLFVNCIEYSDQIDPNYRNLFSNYKVDNFIVFINTMNDRDSIRIVNIDSSKTSHGPSNLPFKEISIEIEHYPINHWNNGIVRNNSSKTYQSLLSIIKEQRSNNKEEDVYLLSIALQDFIGALDYDNLYNRKVDTVLRFNNEQRKLTDSSVIEVYWHIDKGLIGYKKQNGTIYNLID